MTKNTQWATRDAMQQAIDSAIRQNNEILTRVGRVYDAYSARELPLTGKIEIIIEMALTLKTALEGLKEDL